ncbi:MAG: mucin desulfatase, partial [Actinomycetota bacterium]|nr:mucin desulfatase [Actinomycetota bacterium]
LLSEPELDSLPLGAIAMAYEAAVRFLTDFLNGDTYFKVDYPDHNLVRCRAQLALANSMIKDADRMSAIVANLQAC